MNLLELKGYGFPDSAVVSEVVFVSVFASSCALTNVVANKSTKSSKKCRKVLILLVITRISLFPFFKSGANLYKYLNIERKKRREFLTIGERKTI